MIKKVPESKKDRQALKKLATRKKSKQVKVDYVDEKRFKIELTEHKVKLQEAKEKGLKEPKIPEYVGECILKMANNLARRSNFNQYTYKDLMISDGIHNCILYYKNFDPTRTEKAFSYFNRIIWRAFIKRISIEKLELYARYKAIENHHVLDEVEINEYGQDDRIPQAEPFEMVIEFIKKYETNELPKMKKVKQDKPDVLKGLEQFF